MAKPNRTRRTNRTSRNSGSTPVENTTAADTAEERDEIVVAEGDSDEVAGVSQGEEIVTVEAEDAEAEAPDDADAEMSDADAVTRDESAAAGKKPAARDRSTVASGRPGAKGTSDAKGKAEAKSKAEAGARRNAKSGNPAKRSTSRTTSTYTSGTTSQSVKPNPRWFVPVMVGILLLGLAWLVVFYVTGGAWPVEAWGNWNLVAGFAILVAGLVMSTRWR